MVIIEMATFKASVLYQNRITQFFSPSSSPRPQISVIPEHMDPGVCWLHFAERKLGGGVAGHEGRRVGGCDRLWDPLEGSVITMHRSSRAACAWRVR